MTIFNPPKFVTRSLIGAVGLSAIAFSMTAPAAHAGKLGAGFDFWKTPEDGGTIEIPDEGIEIPADFFFEGSDPLFISGGPKSLSGHPTGTMGLEPEQETVVCFDQHGNAVSGNSEHAVQCLPDPDEPNPNDPVEPLEWTDTIVERLEDSAQLSEVGDMAIIPIQMKSVSLVGREDEDGNCLEENGCFEVTGGPEPVRYLLKAKEAENEEQLTGNLKLTVTEVETMGNMSFIRGIPSIGEDESCSLDPEAANFDPECLGLPVTFDLLFKEVDEEGNTTETFFTDTIFLEDGTEPGNEDEVFFSFKKTTPEPSTTLGLLFLGLGSVFGLKRRDKAKK